MSSGEIGKYVALLLLQRRHHGHHAGDKARARLTLGAKTAFVPEHSRADGALGGVVRRVDAFQLDEGLQVPVRWDALCVRRRLA